MKNLALKFAVIASRWVQPVSPQTYLDKTPEEGLALLLSVVPAEIVSNLRFAFSESALLAIIEDELDVQLEAGQLTFHKPQLDAQSIMLAQDLHLAFSQDEQLLLDEMADWMFRHTRSAYPESLGHKRTLDIQDEYQELFRLFYHRYQSTLSTDWLPMMMNETRLPYRPLIRQMMQCAVADAIFKSNAMKAFLGDHSGYADAWFRKSYLRSKLSELVLSAEPELELVRHFQLDHSAHTA